MSDINPGYIGFANIDGRIIRCNSFNADPQQTSLFYNHIMGLNDFGSGDDTKIEKPGEVQIQRTIWRPSTIIINASLSCYATENTSDFLFQQAVNGGYINQINFKYFCGGGDRIIDGRIDQFTLNVSAGDMLTMSANILANDIDAYDVATNYTTAEKIITWDKVKVEIDGFKRNDLIQSFSLNIANNVKPVYTNKDGSFQALYPSDLRVGMQEVSGTIDYYIKDGGDLPMDAGTNISRISFSSPGLNFHINAILYPYKSESNMGPYITNIPFVGVDRAFN